jgi:predicted lipoprotein with Yx(FWY)xxD motif
MVLLKTAKFRIAGLLALAISAIVVAGCGSASSTSTSTAAAAQPAATSSTATSSSSESGGESIGMTKGNGGVYLTGDNGRAVYLWVADTGDKSSCSGACAKAWPPVETKGTPKAEQGVNAGDLGTIMRADGSEQVTYKSHPLYYFVADKSTGETKGQGSDSFGAKWWLVAPSGTAITTGSTSAASGGGYGSSSTSSTSGGGGGWG